MEERPSRTLARHRRPQADRDHVHRDLAVLLRARRHPRGPHARAARHAERVDPDEELVQRGAHDARHDDDLPRRRPDHGRLRQLPRAADDRRARHGVPAPQRALVLAVPARRDRAVGQLVRGRRHREGRLVVVPDAVRGPVQPGPRPGLLDPQHPHPHAVVARGRDQLHRHDREHAHPRHELDADAALRLGDADVRRSCCSSRCPRCRRR